LHIEASEVRQLYVINILIHSLIAPSALHCTILSLHFTAPPQSVTTNMSTIRPTRESAGIT